MKNIIKSLLLIIAIVAFVLLLTGCGKKADGIVGSWKYDGADYTYIFNEDGTGSYEAFGNKMEFTYTTEGNKLSILYSGNTSPFETEYSIDGETLNVKDSFGSDTLYKRVK